MKKILLVEDDRTLSETLTRHLDQNGYHTTWAYTKEDAVTKIRNLKFDLILLDITLPDGNGFAVCEEIRQISIDTRIIFLTAKDLENDIIKGYNMGADDYVTKPFSLPVLLKKIAAVTNRMEKEFSGVIYSDSYLRIDFAALTAYAADEPIELTPLEFKFLELLVKNPGHIVTREKILDVVWDRRGNYVEETSLNSMVSRIRGKIDSAAHRYIKTVYGTGYMWIADE
ncbi:MAG: response regulator transcription factor [Lachnospiraceae bacterium]|jgi:DNA-binding response OmpR family regulator|nr:response regulator transcription factor [Bacteroides intestinalis]